MSERLDRRALLGLGALAAGLPPFARAAFGQAGAEPDVDALATGLARARAAAKPLLAIVVPQDAAERAVRGALWGRLLALSSDAELAELALCEVACVATARLADARPAHREAIEREPLAVLLETAGAEHADTVIDPELPPAPERHVVFRSPDLDASEARARERVATLRAALAAALCGDPEVLERRAERARRRPAPEGTGRFGDAAGEVLASALGAPRPRLRDLDVYAAYVLQHATGTSLAGAPAETAQRVRELLGAAAVQRLWERDLPGARWERHTGYCPPCGMAVVPSWSQDFLTFWPEATGEDR